MRVLRVECRRVGSEIWSDSHGQCNRLLVSWQESRGLIPVAFLMILFLLLNFLHVH